MHPLLTTALSNLSTFIYPPICLLCDTVLTQDDPWLCTGCAENLRANQRERDACPRCSQNRRRLACTCELAWDHPFESIHALFDFQGKIREAVHQIKYRGKGRFARSLGQRWADNAACAVLKQVDWIVPVPLHRRRHWKRGYNQAERIARGVAMAAGKSDALRTDLLLRHRATHTQTKLDRDQRWHNLSGAFGINPRAKGDCVNRPFVLVDDVVTTGATTALCTEVLLAAGARSVQVVCLARD